MIGKDTNLVFLLLYFHDYLKIEYSSKSFPIPSRSFLYCICCVLFLFSRALLSDDVIVLEESIFCTLLLCFSGIDVLDMKLIPFLPVYV
jgi:hypothetical protein